jgi:hypothetical protein
MVVPASARRLRWGTQSSCVHDRKHACPHHLGFFCLRLSQRLLPGVPATGIVARVGTYQRDQDHTVLRVMTQNMFEGL